MFWNVVAFLLCVLLPSTAVAQSRIALVVGNSAYRHTPPLSNPKNDATDMAAALRKLGFRVSEGIDLDKDAFDRVLRDFASSLSGANTGVFFYAGHGLQVAGHNYLVPVDAELSTADALDWEMIRLDLVQRVMEQKTQTNVLFLDACRNNPLARNLARALGTRSAEIGRGLAATEAGVGTLISFSTQPGNVALDGSGRNSPFTASLAKRIGASTDDLSALLIDVRNDVRKETQNRQVPWEHSALTARFYFAPLSSVPTPPNPVELTAALKRVEELETELRKEKSAPQRLNVEAKAYPGYETKPPSPSAPFDGLWRYDQVGDASPECRIRTSQGGFTVHDSMITAFQKKGGRVNLDGTFSFARPNPTFKHDTIVISGTLKGRTGAGTFASGACRRRLTFSLD
jgi:hypothetical protein